mmetsp:Transcript_19865/g.18039  ORF Transcript_19865/g.18039 Transcript_19865/m.18039 type:complete len:206 (+) Transcript_19865:1-618(+)
MLLTAYHCDDWAILEVVNESTVFPSFLRLCPRQKLPNPRTTSVKVKCYHAPIRIYRENEIFESLQIWCDDYSKVQQYDRNNKRIIVDGGLNLGSCGSPYIFKNGSDYTVLGMHIASMNEGVNVSLPKSRRIQQKKKQKLDNDLDLNGLNGKVQKVEKDFEKFDGRLESLRSSISESSAPTYASYREGVVLSNIDAIVNFLGTLPQ